MKVNISLKGKTSKNSTKQSLKLRKKSMEAVSDHIEEKPKRQKSLLPPAEYKEEFPPLEVKVNDSMKCVFSVKRKGEYGLPYFDIRLWANTEKYSGPTKQGLSLPIDKMTEVINKLNDIYDECEERELFKEFEE